jgi:hypothetical protein
MRSSLRPTSRVQSSHGGGTACGTLIGEPDRGSGAGGRVALCTMAQPVVYAGLGYQALDLLHRLGDRCLVAHSGRHRDHEAPGGLALVAVEEAEDVDLLVGAQPFGACRHLHFEALALRREAGRVAHLRVLKTDGGGIALPARSGASLAAGRD